MGVWYVDTSAAVKLVVDEPGSRAMTEWSIERAIDLVGSDLLRTELIRTVRRVDPRLVARAQAVIEALDILPVDRGRFRSAATLEPPGLRSLDALHLACALSLGDDLDGIVTYDETLAAAAVAHGLTVVAPA